MLAKSYSFFSGADYDPPEQTFDYAGTIYKQRPFHNILENTLQCYIIGLIVQLHSFLLTMA